MILGVLLMDYSVVVSDVMKYVLTIFLGLFIIDTVITIGAKMVAFGTTLFDGFKLFKKKNRGDD